MSTASLLEISWTDPVTRHKGFVVIDTLIRGLASGGLRLRKGCTLDEVRGLAQGMTLKEALVYDPADNYLPLGGGKGGIDIDPADPRAYDVLTRFLASILPLVKERWNTGEDFGLRQDVLDKVAADLGLASTVDAVFATLPEPAAARKRLAQAFTVDIDGIPLADLVGGYGVAQACLLAAERIQLPQPTAVVQGFGSIGGATARYLNEGGITVVGVADSEGLIRNDEGLDVEALLTARDAFGVIDRGVLRSDDRTAPTQAWLDVPCDILVPAAMSYVIQADDVSRIAAQVIVEGANMPTLPDAEEALFARGIPVVPDFLANVMTNAWWWWVVFGDIAPTAESSYSKISTVMRRLVTTVATAADESGRTLRQCARELTRRNSEAATTRAGMTA